jgi:hypothetical protein
VGGAVVSSPSDCTILAVGTSVKELEGVAEAIGVGGELDGPALGRDVPRKGVTGPRVIATTELVGTGVGRGEGTAEGEALGVAVGTDIVGDGVGRGENDGGI